MEIAKLQYITNYQSQVSHLEQVKQVIEAGVNWIQYRPKETSEVEILDEGKEIAALCKQNGVVFIMNDSVDIALELDADGVHLGKEDMSPSAARLRMGDKKIIGGTSNTTGDIIDLVNQGVDYVGLGPYQFTQTKKNLSPVLGTEGYSEIISELKQKDIYIPIVAIGGIKDEDFSPLVKTGIHGIAISSLISEANNITEKAREIFNQLQ